MTGWKKIPLGHHHWDKKIEVASSGECRKFVWTLRFLLTLLIKREKL